MRKYVSARSYSAQTWCDTTEKLVLHIKKKLTEARARGEYLEGYSAYLLTPWQKEAIEKSSTNWSIEEKTDLIMRNIVQYNVVSGITERMTESMEILQHIMDHEKKMTALFQKFGLERTNATSSSSRPRKFVSSSKMTDGGKASRRVHMLMANVGMMSTSVILDELKSDTKIFEQMIEYVKYDQKIYEFALDVHEKQYAAINL